MGRVLGIYISSFPWTAGTTSTVSVASDETTGFKKTATKQEKQKQMEKMKKDMKSDMKRDMKKEKATTMAWRSCTLDWRDLFLP